MRIWLGFYFLLSPSRLSTQSCLSLQGWRERIVHCEQGAAAGARMCQPTERQARWRLWRPGWVWSLAAPLPHPLKGKGVPRFQSSPYRDEQTHMKAHTKSTSWLVSSWFAHLSDRLKFQPQDWLSTVHRISFCFIVLYLWKCWYQFTSSPFVCAFFPDSCEMCLC